MSEDKYIPSFFEYDNGIATINILEYDYPKSEFNLKNEEELMEFIKTINSLYNECDEDRIRYDNDANTEYYKRDKIVSLVQEELNEQNRLLTLEKNFEHEKTRVMAKIEVLNRLQEQINWVLD